MKHTNFFRIFSFMIVSIFVLTFFPMEASAVQYQINHSQKNLLKQGARFKIGQSISHSKRQERLPEKLLIVEWGTALSSQSVTKNVEQTDWSGSIATNSGALRLVRTMKFESNDTVSHTAGSDIAWNSFIRNRRDGLVIAVNASEDTSLNFTNSFIGTQTFTVASLMKHPYVNNTIKIAGSDLTYIFKARIVKKNPRRLSK